MALTDKAIAVFKAMWKKANPLVSDEFLEERIEKINKEHEHADKLRENKEPETKVIYTNEKPESQLKKYSDATFIILVILIFIALLNGL